MDALFFDEGTVLEQILYPNRHELAIRMLSGTFLLTFFLFAKQLLTKNHFLQQRLQQKSQELIASNLECEALIYSFTHEMRTNLDSIYAAEQVISDKHLDSLSKEGHLEISKINKSCRKMSAEITDALDLSKAIRAKLDCHHISLNQLVQEITKEIISEDQGVMVSIEIDRNINFICDPDLMRIAIKILCINIINFCRPNRYAEISVGAETFKGKQTFFVRHNDMSTNLNSSLKLFNISDYLTSTKKRAANHAGLTSVQTIIERHGGQILIDDTKKIGSAFYFTL